MLYTLKSVYQLIRLFVRSWETVPSLQYRCCVVFFSNCCASNDFLFRGIFQEARMGGGHHFAASIPTLRAFWDSVRLCDTLWYTMIHTASFPQGWLRNRLRTSRRGGCSCCTGDTLCCGKGTLLVGWQLSTHIAKTPPIATHVFAVECCREFCVERNNGTCVSLLSKRDSVQQILCNFDAPYSVQFSANSMQMPYRCVW